LYAHNNPLPKIPKEIIKRHKFLPTLTSYLTDLELGKSPNSEVKTILIGNGSVGKTQVANRLEKGKAYVFEEKHASTHAIGLHKKNLKCAFLENGLDLNIWDFGGQDMYHATHHLFMQTRALFILVWDAENEVEGSQHEYKGVKYDNFPLRYWLEYANYFGKESPVLVVRNKADIHGKAFEMPKGLKESYQTEYPNIVGFVEVSAKTGENFYGLEKQIQKAFEENENLRNELINKQLPTAWVRMRNKIREEQQKEGGLQQISKETFKEWCKEELIPDSAPTLLDFFHQTGVFFYDETHFSGQIILDQSWAISAVYKVLDKDAAYFGYLQEQQGKLNYGDICEIWQEYSDAQRELFLGFMLSCELCFETTKNKEYNTPLKDRTFIVPQLLNKEINFSLKNALHSFALTEKETKKFAFLPTSLMQRFIIKAHSLAKIEDIWQKGILLCYEGKFALVEAFYGREPYLQIQYNPAAKTKLVPTIWAEFDKLEGKENAKLHQERNIFENVYFEGLDTLISPNQKYSKKEIQRLISGGKISEAIQALLLHFEGDAAKENLVIHQSQRFSQIETKRYKGTIAESEYSLESSKIVDALLHIL
ncbi:MAG: COR domain-containing protein, partial [Bacteroidia bacterium]